MPGKWGLLPITLAVLRMDSGMDSALPGASRSPDTLLESWEFYCLPFGWGQEGSLGPSFSNSHFICSASKGHFPELENSGGGDSRKAPPTPSLIFPLEFRICQLTGRKVWNFWWNPCFAQFPSLPFIPYPSYPGEIPTGSRSRLDHPAEFLGMLEFDP